LNGAKVVAFRYDEAKASGHPKRWTDASSWAPSGDLGLTASTGAIGRVMFTSLAKGDFDGDGRPDLAFAHDDTRWDPSDCTYGWYDPPNPVPGGGDSQMDIHYGDGSHSASPLTIYGNRTGIAAFTIPGEKRSLLASAGFTGAGQWADWNTSEAGLYPQYGLQIWSEPAGRGDWQKIAEGVANGRNNVLYYMDQASQPSSGVDCEPNAYWMGEGVRLGAAPIGGTARDVELIGTDWVAGLTVPTTPQSVEVHSHVLNMSDNGQAYAVSAASGVEHDGGPAGTVGVTLYSGGSMQVTLASAAAEPVIVNKGGVQAHAFLNTDADATTFVFDRWEAQYSDPTILAVLAAPPYFKDVDGIDPDHVRKLGSTELTQFGGSGSSSETKATSKIGAYVSVEEEFSFFGITVAETEAESEFTSSVTDSYKQSQSIEFSTEYGAEEDSVVLIVVPCDTFYYTAYVPSDDGTVVVPTTLIYRVPRDPIRTTMSIERYEKLSEAYRLPEIGHDVLKHTQGRPDTYAAYDPKDFQFRGGGGDGVWQTPGWGESSTSQAVKIETEDEHTTESSTEISFKFGGGAGGVSAGAVMGSEDATAKATTQFNGSEFTGKVHAFPEISEIPSPEPYGFSWMMLEKMVKVGDSTVPYITYATKNVTSAVPTARDFHAEDVTAHGATFAWEEPPATAGAPAPTAYQLLRLVNGDWVPQAGARVPAGQTLMTISNLAPGVKQQFALRTESDGESVTQRKFSARTPAVQVATPEAEGVPVVTANAAAVTTMLGGDAPMGVTAVGVGGKPVTEFQWERWTGTKWKPIQGANEQNYDLRRVTLDDLTRYRCLATQLVDGKDHSAYSDPVTVQLGNVSSQIGVGIQAPFGARDIRQGDKLKATATVANAVPSTLPTGTMSFQLYRIDQSGKPVPQGDPISQPLAGGMGVAVTLGTGTLEVGSYQVAAAYSGDANYRKGTSSAAQFYVAGPDGTDLHEIDATATGGGVIAPAGTVYVPDGGSQAFTATPAPGYRLAGYRLDGASALTQPGDQVLSQVGSDHTIQAVFEAKAPLPVSQAQQTVVAGSGQARFQILGVPAGVTGFTVTYTVDGQAADTTRPGLYDVAIERPEDATYQGVSLFLPGALKVIDHAPTP
ncbi:MAG: Ig-like domain-containing protein, partial [Bifidobacteriaceae bacterium]|nr:Ig-like domain-containing protein [Bifidobacteriaceae bacterium]